MAKRGNGGCEPSYNRRVIVRGRCERQKGGGGNNKQGEEIKRCDRSTRTKVQPPDRSTRSYFCLSYLFGDILDPRVILITTVILCGSREAERRSDVGCETPL